MNLSPDPRPVAAAVPEGIPSWFAATLAAAIDPASPEDVRARNAAALREVARLATESLAEVNRAAGRGPRRRRA